MRLSARQGESDTLDEAEAMAGIALAAIASDGIITKDEAEGLGTSLMHLGLFQDMGEGEVNALFAHLVGIANEHGVEALISRSAAALTPALKETAYALAVDLLMVDGATGEEERAFLAKLQTGLAVSDVLAAKILEVMAIKNRD